MDKESVEFVEWRAGLIKNPIKRLRYLQQANQLDAPPPKIRRSRRWGLLIVGLVLAAIGVRSASDASGHRSPSYSRHAPPAS